MVALLRSCYSPQPRGGLRPALRSTRDQTYDYSFVPRSKPVPRICYGSRLLQSPLPTCCQPVGTDRRSKGQPSAQRVAALENFQAFAFRAALTDVLEHMPASARAERTAQAAEGCALIQRATAPKGVAPTRIAVQLPALG